MITTNINATNTPATLDFFGHAPDIRSGAILLREVIGWIHSFNYSLLGAHPSCGDDLELDRRHKDVRKFTDEAGLQAYKEYLSDLIDRSSQVHPDLQPELMDAGADGSGFTYTVHSGRSSISFYRRSDAYDGWDVRGIANFASSEAADRVRANLANHGLDAKVLSGGGGALN